MVTERFSLGAQEVAVTVGVDLPVVNEPFPANPHAVLSPGPGVQGQISTANRIVELLPGSYGDQQISPAAGVYLFCRNGQAVFTAPSAGGKRWCESGGNNVTLRGLKIDRYGTNAFEGDAALRTPSGGQGWKLIDIEIMRAVNTGIQIRGWGHTFTRPVIHDCGRYAWHGGWDTTIKDGKVFNMCLSGGLVPRNAPNGDNGVTKMAGGSSGMFIDGLEISNIAGNGVWWDGARDGRIRGLVASGVERSPVHIEVCWGGADSAPPGNTVTFPNPAFVVEDIEVDGQTGINDSNQFWPGPAAVEIAMTPGVAVSGVYARNASNGLVAVFSPTHNVFSNGFPAQGISAAWAQANLTLDRVTFEEFDLDEITRYTAALTSGAPSKDGLSWDPGSGSYGTNPKFRYEGATDLNLAGWLAAIGG